MTPCCPLYKFSVSEKVLCPPLGSCTCITVPGHLPDHLSKKPCCWYSILKQPTNISMNMTNQDKCMFLDGIRKQVMSLTVPCDLTLSYRYLAAAFTLRTSCGRSSAYGISWLPSSSTSGATTNFFLCGWLMMWLTGLSVNAPICFALSWPLADWAAWRSWAMSCLDTGSCIEWLGSALKLALNSWLALW